jgi:hypothetical protein
VRWGFDAGAGYAVQRTLPDEHVKMPLVFAGVRAEKQYNSLDVFSMYAHLLRSGKMTYDETIFGVEENKWGARFGSFIMVELTPRIGFTSSFELALEPVARVNSGWPGFRVFLSMGVALAL